MSMGSKPEIYFSFFMFTADLKPNDKHYTKTLINHLSVLSEMGYDGFDLHIPPPSGAPNYQAEIESYKSLKEEFNKNDFNTKRFTTNVGTTRTFDPTSPYKEQRNKALAYLKSRVDITAMLDKKGSIMSGPFIYPYGVFPNTDNGEQIWSDALCDWMQQRYDMAYTIIADLTKYASDKGVKLAIEPVKSWETPGPTSVLEVLEFIDKLGPSSCGVTLDTAQVLMESDGPSIFNTNVDTALEKGLLHYVHISAPDRGAIHDCWIPWDIMLGKIAPSYTGPYLIEIFNAIPPFESSMRMARRRFTIPGESGHVESRNAYRIAEKALMTIRQKIDKFMK